MLRVMILANKSDGTNKPFVRLSVETHKIYDMHISSRGTTYFLNCREVDALPNCASKTMLENFYNQHKAIIEEFLSDPTNDNWWKLKELGG
jgi:hypothetical protein